MKGMAFLVLFIVLMGCSGSGNHEGDQDDDLYPDSFFELSSFSIASLQENNSNILELPPKLNSWGITTLGSARTQIALKLRARNPMSMLNDPSVWALFIRTDPDPIGVKNFNEIKVNLFYNHSENDQICCINSLPFEDFDIAEES